MTTALSILKKLSRRRPADPIYLDARILRDIGLSPLAVTFAPLR